MYNRRIKAVRHTLRNSCLIWLVLVALLLHLNLNKRTSKAKHSREVNNSKYTIEKACFDPKKLMWEVIVHQQKHRIWVNSTYFKRAKDFQGPVYVNTTKDEKKCPDLYKLAKKILNGLKVKLPFETNNTFWKFRERIDLNKLRETKLRWNHPWEQSNSKQTMEFLRRYNVSANTIRRRKILITYGHNCCNGSKSRAVKAAINFGKMDYAEALDLKTLPIPFQLSHRNIMRMGRGAGYWLWKPYILLQALLYKLNDGDLLVYQDSGSYLSKDIGPLLRLCQDQKPSILTFSLLSKERSFSKRDAFVVMGMDDPIVYDGEQRLANLIVAMKNCESVQYFMEYLAYAADVRVNTDRENVLGKPNLQSFIENRHDQTVHSLLSKKWGILTFRDPCACHRNRFDKRGRYASGPYQSLYVHDRNRD